MILEVARAILNVRHTGESTFTTGSAEAERAAFERRMARLRSEQYAWAPLSALVGAIAQRRGRWS